MTRPANVFFAALLAGTLGAQELGAAWGTGPAEAAHYRIVELPIPPELALECGSMCPLPDNRLAIGTRRGEILIVDGAFDELPATRVHRFAAGLDEVLGLGYRDGAFYATQQTELLMDGLYFANGVAVAADGRLSDGVFAARIPADVYWKKLLRSKRMSPSVPAALILADPAVAECVTSTARAHGVVVHPAADDAVDAAERRAAAIRATFDRAAELVTRFRK